MNPQANVPPLRDRSGEGRKAELVLVIGFLLPLLATPIWRATRTGAAPFSDAVADLGGELAAAPDGWSANHVLERRIDGLNDALEDGSPWRETLMPAIQARLLAWGGVGNETAIAGRPGWLHLRSGIDGLLGKPFLDPAVLERRRRSAPAWEAAIEPDPRPAILAFHAALARRGVRLVLLPVPAKAAVQPGSLLADPHLGSVSASGSGLVNPSLPRFLAEIQAAGIAVVDPAPALKELAASGVDAFLRTDSHWSPAGVDVAARELAGWIEGEGPARRAPADETAERTRWRSEPVEVEGRGDLLAALRLDAAWAAHLFGRERTTLERVVDAEGRLWRPDRRAAVLLLGDSFTNVFSTPGLGWGAGGGLAERLAFHSGLPVDRLALDAGAPTGVRRQLARDAAAGRDRLAGKRLVIWELALRELSSGDWAAVDFDGG